jgi:hypothetical protein
MVQGQRIFMLTALEWGLDLDNYHMKAFAILRSGVKLTHDILCTAKWRHNALDFTATMALFSCPLYN